MGFNYSSLFSTLILIPFCFACGGRSTPRSYSPPVTSYSQPPTSNSYPSPNAAIDLRFCTTLSKSPQAVAVVQQEHPEIIQKCNQLLQAAQPQYPDPTCINEDSLNRDYKKQIDELQAAMASADPTTVRGQAVIGQYQILIERYKDFRNDAVNKYGCSIPNFTP